jgi:hypothetical protein
VCKLAPNRLAPASTAKDSIFIIYRLDRSGSPKKLQDRRSQFSIQLFYRDEGDQGDQEQGKGRGIPILCIPFIPVPFTFLPFRARHAHLRGHEKG